MHEAVKPIGTTHKKNKWWLFSTKKAFVWFQLGDSVIMPVLVSPTFTPVAENIPLGEAETLNLTLVVSVLVYVCHLVDRWPAQCVPCVSPSGCWDKPQISFLENVLKLWIAFNKQYIFSLFFFKTFLSKLIFLYIHLGLTGASIIFLSSSKTFEYY